QGLFHMSSYPRSATTLSPMGRETYSLCKSLENLIKLCFGQMRVHDLVVDVHHWRLITRCQTLHTAQGKTSVWSGFTGFDAQLVFEIAQATTRALKGARQINTDFQTVFPMWLGWKQRIKGRDAFHVHHRHLQQICHSLADLIIDLGKLTHCQVQRR